MRNFSATLKAALATQQTTVGWLLSVTLRNGTVLRVNSIGADYSYGGNTYFAYPGFTMGRARFSSQGDGTTVRQGSAAVSVGPILFDDAAAGLYDGASCILTFVDWMSGEAVTIGFKWRVGKITLLDNGMISFDIWSELRTNHSLFVKKYGPTCTADLGNARCGVDIAGSFQDVATVSGASIDAFSFAVTGTISPVPADSYYENGAIKFTSGANNGFAYDIRKWVQSTGVITLFSPLRRALVGGETAIIHPGCDKTTGANGCTKFANNARFQGFMYLPEDPPERPTTDPLVPAAPAPPYGGIPWVRG